MELDYPSVWVCSIANAHGGGLDVDGERLDWTRDFHGRVACRVSRLAPARIGDVSGARPLWTAMGNYSQHHFMLAGLSLAQIIDTACIASMAWHIVFPSLSYPGRLMIIVFFFLPHSAAASFCHNDLLSDLPAVSAPDSAQLAHHQT